MLMARVFGFVPVARSRGTATDKGEVMRGLAELPWRPFAFCQAPWLPWEAVATNKLRAAFDDGRTQAAVESEAIDFRTSSSTTGFMLRKGRRNKLQTS